MDAYRLMQEVKCHAVLVSLAAYHSNFEFATFLNVAKSFIYKVLTELICSGRDMAPVAKRRKHSQR